VVWEDGRGDPTSYPMSFLEKQALLAFGRWIEYSWLNIFNFLHVFRGNYPVGILLCIVSNG